MDKESLEDLIGNQQMTAYRYGSFVQNRIVKLLDRADERASLKMLDILEGLTGREIGDFIAGNYSTKRLLRLRESIRDLKKEVTATTSSVLGDEGKKFAGYEAERMLSITSAMGLDTLGVSISASQAYSAAMARPMLGRHIKDHIKGVSATHSSIIESAIREGFVLGESTSRIMQRIRGSVDLKHKDGIFFKRNGSIERLIVRNALGHISAVASAESMKAAGIEEYYLSPVFDGRTSDICRTWNSGGIEYFKVGKGPLPPFHPGGCRTVALPKIRGNANVEKPFINDSRPLSKIPKDQRKGKIGKTNAKTFEQHFKRQSVDLQKEWLGPTRYKLWKGGLSLGKFADPRRGKVYNLDELRQRNSDIFKAVGL